MKVEIDLQDILGDEYGDMESLSDSIQRQVKEAIENRIAKGIMQRVNDEVDKIIQLKIGEYVETQLPSLFAEIIDAKYTVRDKWGSNARETSMRQELLSTLLSQMEYKKTNYDSEKNYFTRNVDAVLSDCMKNFKDKFDTKVNDEVVKEAFDYAVHKLNKVFLQADK